MADLAHEEVLIQIVIAELVIRIQAADGHTKNVALGDEPHELVTVNDRR